MVFNEGNPLVNFVIGFTKSPRHDFGIYAKGYSHAAKKISDILLEEVRFPDYEAYPTVFLYRHAFELSLKNIIYRSALLCAFQEMGRIDSNLYNSHFLPLLAGKACKILGSLFPDDQDIKQLMDDLLSTAKDLSDIDENSYVYRYPIRKDGSACVNQTQIVNLEELSSRMNCVLNKLDILDFGLDVEIEKARIIYEILERIAED